MSLILGALAAYLLVGAIFALAFVASGVKAIDPVAATAPLRIRLIFAPGAAALWPLLIRSWLRSGQRAGQRAGLRAGRRDASVHGASHASPTRKEAN